jgi:hypothetical protein
MLCWITIIFCGLGRQRDDVALAAAVAGDVDALAVDLDQAVVDELAGLRAGGRPAGAVHDVVEALLEHAQQVLAGRTPCWRLASS